MFTENAAADDGVDELEPPVDNLEIKDGQWMGATVRSQIGSDGKVNRHFSSFLIATIQSPIVTDLTKSSINRSSFVRIATFPKTASHATAKVCAMCSTTSSILTMPMTRARGAACSENTKTTHTARRARRAPFSMTAQWCWARRARTPGAAPSL